MLPAKPFYMIRHGQTVANDNRILDGSKVNSPLTKTGETQASDVAPYLTKLKLKPSEIFHSPLKRTTKTAELLNEMAELSMTVLKGLQEQFFGEWEGDPIDNFQQIFKEASKGIGAVNPPKGEAQKDFVDRIHNAIKDALERSSEGPPLLVTHGGAIMAFALYYGLSEYVRQPKNCELYLFEPDTKNPKTPWKISVFELKDDEPVQKCASFCPEKLSPTQPQP
jgi:broad specificity phosphatase PhoE